MDDSLMVDQNLIMLYEDVLVKCESKLNPVRLVRIVERVAQQYLHTSPPTLAQLDKALDFIDRFAHKAFLGEEARIIALMIIAELQLLAGRKEAAWALLQQVGPQVRSLEGTGAESAVKSAFFRAEAAYYKAAGPAGNFYRSTIQYLAHTPASSLSPEKRLEIAVDVSLAALVATDVYNFGEVLAQHIVSELETAPAHRWIYDLLGVFNEGNVAGFNQLVNTHRAAYEGTPVLVASQALLKQKVALLCLMKIVFDRPTHERVVKLADIASACKLEADQAEWLVMRAFSQELIKGSIDQIDGTVTVSWLLPRVLDLSQTKVLDEKLISWKAKVQEAMQLQAPMADLF